MIKINKDFFKKINIVNFLIILSIFFADRISKIYVIKYILEKNRKIYVNDYLNLDLTWNTGIGFGLFNFEPGKIYHLISLIIFFVIVFLIFLIIKSVDFDKYLYSVILAGALGNFYDRLSYSAVPDFIDIHFNDYHWFTFNIADIFISLGVILLILKEVIFKRHEKN